MRYRAISELVEIGAAYDAAIENFPDNLEPDSVEGRREVISSALNYLKNNGIVPSQQSLGLIQNELIRYDRDGYEGIFGFATNEKETRDLIEQNWDIDGFIVYVNLEWSIPTNKLTKYIKSDIFPIIQHSKIEGILCFEDFDIIRKMENLVFINLRNTIIFDAKSKQFGSIPEAAFKSMNIVSVVLPESIRIIGRAAFFNCTGLSFLVFPKSLRYIGNYSFDSCSGLVKLYIGDNITYIGHSAFGHCANLEEITLSENVASIQHNAFKESLNLRTIYCKSKNPPSVLEKHWHGSNKRSMNLYVPKGFSNRYKIQEGWRFFNIYEEDI